MEKTFVVYRIKNLVNGRMYFGSTRRFARRRQEHLRSISDRSGPTHFMRLDIRGYGFTVADFSFRILARFDNEIDMLECEQKFLKMYWGTTNCYNSAFQVVEGWVTRTLVVWNMKTLEARNYLSCHAVRKDLGIDKGTIQKILGGLKVHSNFWVVENWGKRRTVREVVEIYRSQRVRLPTHALDPRQSHTPIPGVCSLADLVYRKRSSAILRHTGAKRMVMTHNHHDLLVYGTKPDFAWLES
jgi:hypothetical protein